MIGQKQKGRKQAVAVKNIHNQADARVKKTFTAYDGTVLTIDPELDKFYCLLRINSSNLYSSAFSK